MITVENLQFSYGKKALFDSLSVEFRGGSIYGLLGKNGAGKSTLLKLISGLLFPAGGSCRIDGVDSIGRSPEILSELCFIGEEFVLPPLSMDQYVALYAPFYPRFDRSILKNAMQEFELHDTGLLNKMSYGQMKKFLISFGIACQSKVLILDEPTNGLDIPSKSQFRKLLAGNITDDRVFIVSTHQVRDMQNLIDPIVMLDEGNIVFNAGEAEISSRITIDVTQTRPGDDALYSEKIPGGYAVLNASDATRETPIDLEVLFNAVTKNPEAVARLFDAESAASQKEDSHENTL